MTALTTGRVTASASLQTILPNADKQIGELLIRYFRNLEGWVNNTRVFNPNTIMSKPDEIFMRTIEDKLAYTDVVRDDNRRMLFGLLSSTMVRYRSPQKIASVLRELTPRIHEAVSEVIIDNLYGDKLLPLK